MAGQQHEFWHELSDLRTLHPEHLLLGHPVLDHDGRVLRLALAAENRSGPRALRFLKVTLQPEDCPRDRPACSVLRSMGLLFEGDLPPPAQGVLAWRARLRAVHGAHP